jgi:hypothetical protein
LEPATDSKRFRFLSSCTVEQRSEVFHYQFLFIQEGCGGHLKAMRFAVDKVAGTPAAPPKTTEERPPR